MRKRWKNVEKEEIFTVPRGRNIILEIKGGAKTSYFGKIHTSLLETEQYLIWINKNKYLDYSKAFD